jgi:hypothetical protein
MYFANDSPRKSAMAAAALKQTPQPKLQTYLTGPASENLPHKPTSSALSMPRTPQVVTISKVGSGRCSAPSDLLDRKGARQITEAAH